jgi:hypothetical protein
VLQPKGLNFALLCVELAGGYYRIFGEYMFYATFLLGLDIAKKSVRSLEQETGLLLLPRKLTG